jgi:hypothetical protein
MDEAEPDMEEIESRTMGLVQDKTKFLKMWKSPVLVDVIFFSGIN